MAHTDIGACHCNAVRGAFAVVVAAVLVVADAVVADVVVLDTVSGVGAIEEDTGVPVEGADARRVVLAQADERIAAPTKRSQGEETRAART